MSITKMLEENKQLTDKLYGECYAPNWNKTPWERYCLLGPKQKGGFGERVVDKYLVGRNHDVKPPVNAGHDRIVDGSKMEIKFSVASSNTKSDGKLIDPDSFTFNHIAVGKDWRKFLFVGINPKSGNPNIRHNATNSWPDERVYVMDKSDFVRHMNKKNTFPFRAQQGGRKADNDDFIVAGKDACRALFALPFVREYTGPKSL